MQIITIDILNDIISAGNKLCFTNTVVDIKLIRDNPDWFKQQLKAGTIFIECWSTQKIASPADTLDEMVAKPFFWSSFNFETQPCTSFKDVPAQLSALAHDFSSSLTISAYAQYALENWEYVEKVANLVIKYGLPKGKWPMGKWLKPLPISEADAAELGVEPTIATRTEILKAASKTGKWEPYTRYNIGYCKGIASQHCCTGILTANGAISVIPQK